MRGSFQCVAEVIRVLRRKGREDVIEALARHEIGYHTDRHSEPLFLQRRSRESGWPRASNGSCGARRPAGRW